MLGEVIAEIEKLRFALVLLFCQTLTVLEVDRFPSGSVTPEKDAVGELGNILFLLTGLIYINSAFDVDGSPVVLIVNILGTQENHKAIRLYS